MNSQHFFISCLKTPHKSGWEGIYLIQYRSVTQAHTEGIYFNTVTVGHGSPQPAPSCTGESWHGLLLAASSIGCSRPKELRKKKKSKTLRWCGLILNIHNPKDLNKKPVRMNKQIQPNGKENAKAKYDISKPKENTSFKRK